MSTNPTNLSLSWRRLVGIALLWVALSALVYVPTSEGGLTGTLIAFLGFLAFSTGIVFLLEDLKRELLSRQDGPRGAA